MSEVTRRERAISNAAHYLNPDPGGEVDASAASMWLRTAFPRTHPNYLSVEYVEGMLKPTAYIRYPGGPEHLSMIGPGPASGKVEQPLRLRDAVLKVRQAWRDYPSVGNEMSNAIDELLDALQADRPQAIIEEEWRVVDRWWSETPEEHRWLALTLPDGERVTAQIKDTSPKEEQ